MTKPLSERALILAPLGRDAAVAAAMLAEVSVETHIVRSLPELCEALGAGAGFIITTEEALRTADLHGLSGWLAEQPEWSDMPFVLLTSRGGGLEQNPAAARYLEMLGNVTFLERPFHPTTLISVARSALRARRRQYEARARLEALNESERQFRTLANALREAERRLEAVLNNASVAIFTTDERQHCSYMNQAAEKLTGYTLAETAGRPLHDVIHHTRPDGTHFPLHECATDRVFRQNTQEQGEETFVHRDGSFYPVAFSASPLCDDQSKPVGAILEVRNIEEEKALQNQLHHIQRMEAIGQLTGGVAHDFNNLLAIAIANLDLLEENVPLDPDAQELLESARNACLGGAELTGRLLAFARKQVLQPVSTDINHLISDYSKLLMRLLGAHIDLHVNLAEGLWQATVDRGQLEAAITNLSTNARDAMFQGGRLDISTRNEVLDSNYARKHPGLATGDYVAIDVTDSGSGMTPEVQARAIEPFFTTKQEGKGTGLGLSMVFGFAKQSGGHVRIYSEPGHGTTVTLLVPRAKSAAADEGAWERPAAPRAKPGETVLVVDDNAALLRVAVAQLTALGYEVLQAGDGPSALEVLKDKAGIDLLLTDIIMPGGLSGVDLGLEARRVLPQLRLMYMSGFPESAFGDEARLDPETILLRKPFRQAELAVRVREALER